MDEGGSLLPRPVSLFEAFVTVVLTLLAFGVLFWLGVLRLFHGPLSVYPPTPISVAVAIGIPLIPGIIGVLGLLRWNRDVKWAAGLALGTGVAGLALLVVSVAMVLFVTDPGLP